MPRPGQSKRFGIRAFESVANNLGWVLTENAKIIIFKGEEAREVGTDLVLNISQMGRPSNCSITLTQMTEEELLASKAVLDRAYQLALPIVQRRDKEAQDAAAAGDDTYPRIYRAVPQLVYREGAIAEYSQSLYGGPPDFPRGDGDGQGVSGGDGSANS